jgi:predicted TIM-barrel fold metal-dependent hydrolase
LSGHCHRRALLGRRTGKTFTGGEAGRPGEQYARLKDLGSLRLKEVDEAGIDIQVLSHGAPSTQKLPAETAAAIARRVNDRLHKVVAGNPARFAAFAALPTAVPAAAADELERTAALGFKGAMLHGLANGVFLHDPRFWPIYARAEKLDLPIYMHPSLPQADVMRIYYQDYAKDFPMITRATWGYTVETATLAIRLALSGVFEKYPKLKIILGHLGETCAKNSGHYPASAWIAGSSPAMTNGMLCHPSSLPPSQIKIDRHALPCRALRRADIARRRNENVLPRLPGQAMRRAIERYRFR